MITARSVLKKSFFNFFFNFAFLYCEIRNKLFNVFMTSKKLKPRILLFNGVLFLFFSFFNRRYSLLSFRLPQRILILSIWRLCQSPIQYAVFFVEVADNSTTHNTLLLNDGAKRNRLLYLKIIYTQVKKILCLP